MSDAPEADVPLPVFKKKKVRAPPREVTSSQAVVAVDQKGDDGDDVSTTLSEVRFLQKHRQRNKGLAATAQPEDDAPEVEMDSSGQPKLETAFQVEKSSEAIADTVMEKWVAEELQKKLTGKSKEEREKEAAEERKRNRSAEDSLYDTPEFLKVKKADEEEVVESGDRWLTGIAEVQLPIAFKLKNIEETEKAKMEKFEKRKMGSDHDPSHDLPTNFSSNFKKHKKDWDKGMRERDEALKAAQGRAAKPVGVRNGVPVASDDRAVSRFIKQQRR